MDKIKLLLGASLLFSVSMVQASLINPSASIVEDGEINIINGLEWLDLDVTSGLSVRTALASHAGYRIATETEFHAMFSLFGIGGDDKFLGDNVYSTQSNDLVSLDRHQGATQVSAISYKDSFAMVFDLTQRTAGSNRYRNWAIGLYEDDAGILHYGGTSSSVYRDGSVGYGEFVEFYDDSYDRNAFWSASGNYDVGTFLVKEVSVPEPSILALLCFGLAGLGFARLSKQKA